MKSPFEEENNAFKNWLKFIKKQILRKPNKIRGENQEMEGYFKVIEVPATTAVPVSTVVKFSIAKNVLKPYSQN